MIGRCLAARRLLIACIVLAIATLAGARPAAASCASTTDDESTVVFVGVATDVRQDDEPFGLAAATSTFLVEAWENGSSEPEALVRTNVAGVDLGDQRGGVADARPVVVRGDRWIVHARPGADGVLDAACSESTRLAVGIPTPTSNATRWAMPLTLAALALIGAGTASVISARRRRRIDSAPIA